MLQIGLDLILGDAANFASMCASIFVGFYLLLLWRRQENRLLTDLPLAFGLSFLFASINTIILLSTGYGLLPDTLGIFRIRAFSVFLSVFPMSIILLNVWLYRFQHRHRQILAAEVVYSLAVCAFGPSESIIMILIILVVLIVIVALTSMFIITWRTGRLKEVNSGLLVLSLLLMVVSQVALIALQSQGLSFIAHIIRGISTILAGLALGNPLYRWRESRTKDVSSEKESTPSFQTRLKSRLAQSSLLALTLVFVPLFYFIRDLDIYLWNVDETAINVMPSKVISLTILLAIFWYLRNEEFKPVLGLNKVHIRWLVILGVSWAVAEYILVNVVSTAIYVGFIDSGVEVQFIIAMDAFLIVWNFALFLINAVFEETCFRGLTYHGFKGRFGVNKAIIAAAIIFGFWHICWPIQEYIQTGVFPVSDVFVKVVFSGILGGIFSVWYVKFSEEKSLMGPIAAHTFINYLNEGFKLTPAAEAGPDLSFLSPVHMAMGLSIVLAIFIISYIVFWRTRMTDFWGGEESEDPIPEEPIESDFISEEVSPLLQRKYKSKSK
ncbi:MAG: CPBP family intramembrane glutamic endopeptidase [Candidatus Thorarchaeota archaeon]